MSARQRIAVLFGGASNEAEVSKVSAAGVAAALTAQGHDVHSVPADRNLAQRLAQLAPDVVFPALHGPPGEDGTVQGLLEMMELPYVGSGVEASAFAMNKIIAKAAFRLAALPVADEVVVRARTQDVHAACADIGAALGERVAVKPSRQGSALGVTLVRNANELPAALTLALSFGGDVLVERFITGREITVAVLDLFATPARALPVIEIRTAKGTWYDYHNRYTAGASEHLIPAPLPVEITAQLTRIALDAHFALGCRDLSRADFVLDEALAPVLLEVNTLPGMTPTSLFPDAANAVGITFEMLMQQLIDSALARSASIAGARHPQ